MSLRVICLAKTCADIPACVQKLQTIKSQCKANLTLYSPDPSYRAEDIQVEPYFACPADHDVVKYAFNHLWEEDNFLYVDKDFNIDISALISYLHTDGQLCVHSNKEFIFGKSLDVYHWHQQMDNIIVILYNQWPNVDIEDTLAQMYKYRITNDHMTAVNYGNSLYPIRQKLTNTQRLKFVDEYLVSLTYAPKNPEYHQRLQEMGYELSILTSLDDVIQNTERDNISRMKRNIAFTKYIPKQPLDNGNAQIALIMVVKDNQQTILRCLKSVSPLINTWLIYDNNSTDRTADFIQAYFNKIGCKGTLIKTEGTLEDALKQAYEEGISDYLFYISPLNYVESTVDRENLVKLCKSNEHFGVLYARSKRQQIEDRIPCMVDGRREYVYKYNIPQCVEFAMDVYYPELCIIQEDQILFDPDSESPRNIYSMAEYYRLNMEPEKAIPEYEKLYARKIPLAYMSAVNLSKHYSQMDDKYLAIGYAIQAIDNHPSRWEAYIELYKNIKDHKFRPYLLKLLEKLQKPETLAMYMVDHEVYNGKSMIEQL